ncbi:hypothetical protein AVEN_55961-1 [Araneus ventricosus]|uniref:Uncharacterized protein n=1 Tax=Araneus ventricosus TaxID=182803 RepID=A0A4Y2C224_ARAVE|nr:hypothetical protein AVEN_55961-1 [Araneus ventricosus]
MFFCTGILHPILTSEPTTLGNTTSIDDVSLVFCTRPVSLLECRAETFRCFVPLHNAPSFYELLEHLPTTSFSCLEAVLASSLECCVETFKSLVPLHTAPSFCELLELKRECVNYCEDFK